MVAYAGPVGHGSIGFLDTTYTLFPHLVFPSQPPTPQNFHLHHLLQPSSPLRFPSSLSAASSQWSLCRPLLDAIFCFRVLSQNPLAGLPPRCSEMTASLCNNLRSSSLKMDEEAKLIEKQGIVSILGFDCERAKAASLRRTLSADMSSKKWLAQHGFSHMKKIASSQQFSLSAADSSSSSEGEDEYDEEGPGMFQTWSSILSQKASDEAAEKSETVPLPYVHPLMRRSASSLSEKSLQICTESLGSETGSDGFSSSASTQEDKQLEESQEEQEQEEQKQREHEVESNSLGKDELAVVERDNYYSARKRLQPPSSFPPPLPSLSTTQGCGPNVRFETHRRNGRLVLEAVSVPTQNYFQAQRHGGRLVLTLADTPFNYEETSDQEEGEEEAVELGQEFENLEEDENGEAAAEEGEVVKIGQANEFMAEMEMKMEAAQKLPTGMINVHRSALMMKKLMGLVNINPTWPPKLNKAANLEDATPLPPPPRVARIITTIPVATAAATSSFNAYEYCWRSKPPTTTAVLKNNNDKFILSKSSKGHGQQQLLLLRGNKAEHSVPLLRGCKEPRSLSIWEPYYIATS